MLGFLSFLAFVCAIAFVVSVVLLVLRLVKKKSWKPCAVSAAVAVVCVLGLSMPISQLYVPTEKLDEPSTASAVDSTSNVDNSVESVENQTAESEESSEPEQPVASEATSEPASAPTEYSTAPAADSSEAVSSETVDSSESEAEPDTELIRSMFDALLTEYDGGVISIEPRTIDGEVFSWAIIDVVVPDSWYYLEEYQMERYCENVGDYVRTAVVSGGVAENESGVAVHFFDAAGAEVAESKVFGGYKLK